MVMAAPSGGASPGRAGGAGFPLPAAAPSAPAVIAGLAGGGTGWFADQYGHPVLVIGDEPWGLVGGAGRWSSGNWQGEISAYLTSRAAQGYNALEIDLVPSQWNGLAAGSGVTWDGVSMFNGG